MSIYTVLTLPAKPVVDLEAAKIFLRDTINVSEDELIKALVEAANSAGQSYSNRVFVPVEFQGLFDGLEATRCEPVGFITLQKSPLIDVTKVEIFSGGAWVEIAAGTSGYQIRSLDGFSRVLFYSSTIPDSDIPQPYRITFNAGYGIVGGDASSVPDMIKTAVKQHTLFLYENRGDVAPDGKIPMPLETTALYNTVRVINTYG